MVAVSRRAEIACIARSARLVRRWCRPEVRIVALARGPRRPASGPRAGCPPVGPSRPGPAGSGPGGLAGRGRAGGGLSPGPTLTRPDAGPAGSWPGDLAGPGCLLGTGRDGIAGSGPIGLGRRKRRAETRVTCVPVLTSTDHGFAW